MERVEVYEPKMPEMAQCVARSVEQGVEQGVEKGAEQGVDQARTSKRWAVGALVEQGRRWLYDAEAEQGLLGSLMLDAGSLVAVQPLRATDFFDVRHGMIFNAVEQVITGGGAADPVAVAAVLSREAEHCGGLAYLQALRECVPSARHAERLAQVVRERALERGLLAAADGVRDLVGDGEMPVAQKVDEAAQAFTRLAQGVVRREPQALGGLALERSAFYEAVQCGEVQAGWPLGFSALDEALSGGLKPGRLVVLAARPSVGKSSLAQFWALELAAQGLTGLFLSMEMPASELADRAVASVGEVPYRAMLTGRMSQSHWRGAADALERLQALPLFVDDEPALTLSGVKAKARGVKGLKFVVVDYLQLMQGQGDNRNAQIEEVSRGLKALAKELDVCVLALSQLNRQVESRASRRPTLSDLRDSGAIEQDADVVMFLWPVKGLEDNRRLIGLALEKNRQGERCEFALAFDGAVQRWEVSPLPLVSAYEGGGGYGGRMEGRGLN